MKRSQNFTVENADKTGPAIMVCEHASNAFPLPWGDLGLSAAQKQAHVAWDPGALDLARGLAAKLDATLIFSNVSRLICDLNRPPDAPAAMAAQSEVHEVPGNAKLTGAQRLERIQSLYLPFHQAVSEVVAARLATQTPMALLTIHSFTPVYFGNPREVEFGIIHERDDRLARAIAQRPTSLITRLNEPYSATDGVVHTLARHATPFGLPNAMLEIRNDLLQPDAGAVIDMLAPVLTAAIEEVL